MFYIMIQYYKRSKKRLSKRSKKRLSKRSKKRLSKRLSKRSKKRLSKRSKKSKKNVYMLKTYKKNKYYKGGGDDDPIKCYDIMLNDNTDIITFLNENDDSIVINIEEHSNDNKIYCIEYEYIQKYIDEDAYPVILNDDYIDLFRLFGILDTMCILPEIKNMYENNIRLFYFTKTSLTYPHLWLSISNYNYYMRWIDKVKIYKLYKINQSKSLSKDDITNIMNKYNSLTKNNINIMKVNDTHSKNYVEKNVDDTIKEYLDKLTNLYNKMKSITDPDEGKKIFDEIIKKEINRELYSVEHEKYANSLRIRFNEDININIEDINIEDDDLGIEPFIYPTENEINQQAIERLNNDIETNNYPNEIFYFLYDNNINYSNILNLHVYNSDNFNIKLYGLLYELYINYIEEYVMNVIYNKITISKVIEDKDDLLFISYTYKTEDNIGNYCKIYKIYEIQDLIDNIVENIVNKNNIYTHLISKNDETTTTNIKNILMCIIFNIIYKENKYIAYINYIFNINRINLDKWELMMNNENNEYDFEMSDLRSRSSAHLIIKAFDDLSSKRINIINKKKEEKAETTKNKILTDISEIKYTIKAINVIKSPYFKNNLLSNEYDNIYHMLEQLRIYTTNDDNCNKFKKFLKKLTNIKDEIIQEINEQYEVYLTNRNIAIANHENQRTEEVDDSILLHRQQMVNDILHRQLLETQRIQQIKDEDERRIKQEEFKEKYKNINKVNITFDDENIDKLIKKRENNIRNISSKLRYKYRQRIRTRTESRQNDNRRGNELDSVLNIQKKPIHQKQRDVIKK